MGAPAEGYPLSKIDSLEKALELAMRTIGHGFGGGFGESDRTALARGRP